jgi:hypothetical protein
MEPQEAVPRYGLLDVQDCDAGWCRWGKRVEPGATQPGDESQQALLR